MLGIDVNVNMKNVSFPIYFNYEKNNSCVHCGAQHSLTIVDRYGHPTKEEIHPFDHIRCIRCGQKYTIKWVDDGRIYKTPYAADPSIARQFSNYFTKKINNFLGK